MALIQARVYEVRVIVTGEEPGPAETYVEGGTIEAASEFLTESGVVNPRGGEISADIEAADTIAVDVEGVTL